MQKLFLMALVMAALWMSCDPEPPNYCAAATDDLATQTYIGTLNLCNAQPPEMDFLDATATVQTINGNEIILRLQTDAPFLDTLLNFTIDCEVVESTIPLLYLRDESGNETGQYDQQDAMILFRFGYPNCLDNTFFRGFAN